MDRMSLGQFGKIVRRVLESLPEEVHQYLANVVVDVEEEPDAKTLREQLSEEEIADGGSIYGLFSPLPLPNTEAMDFDEPPHRLIIYKRPLEEDFPEREQLMVEIRKTVIHELAHHFGFTDNDLEKFDDAPNPFASRLVTKEAEVHLARLRLACLWVSQVARVVADHALRMFVFLLVAQAGQQASDAAWYQVTPFFVLPFIVLAPVNGAIANGLQKRGVLVGSTAFCLALVVVAAALLPADPQAAWWWCLALSADMMGAAVYSPARYAVLPAAAEECRLPLPRVNGWIELGSGGAGIVGGYLAATQLHGLSWPGDVPAAISLVIGLNVLGLVTALPVRFPTDVVRPESPLRAIGDFFKDSARVWRIPEARSCMLGLACFLAIIINGAGAVLNYTGAMASISAGGWELIQALGLVAIGVMAGSFIASVQGHPYRTLGLVPIGTVGMLIALVWALVSKDHIGPSLALGFTGGMIGVPLRATYQAVVPRDVRGNAMAISNTANYVLVSVLSITMFTLVHRAGLTSAGQLGILVCLTVAGALTACWKLRRPLLEQVTEVVIGPMYRIHAFGPGLGRVPLRGPVLIVANHTAWFDPVWLGKVIPRRIIPMMGSDFYDLPGLRWFMKRIVGAIRVQTATFRREAPELDEAIAALDRGQCVVIFPEGRLRRTPELRIRPFGRGVWHILHERPQTPVVVCWIEGGWGSFFSYAGGPPTKNKRPDWWRHIDVAISEPQILPPELLKDVRGTRDHLRAECLQARSYLGLEVPEADEHGEEDDEESKPTPTDIRPSKAGD
jgi:1-acyl-sn-glycerol-3-phosphate acyltransferase